MCTCSLHPWAHTSHHQRKHTNQHKHKHKCHTFSCSQSCYGSKWQLLGSGKRFVPKCCLPHAVVAVSLTPRWPASRTVDDVASPSSRLGAAERWSTGTCTRRHRRACCWHISLLLTQCLLAVTTERCGGVQPSVREDTPQGEAGQDTNSSVQAAPGTSGGSGGDRGSSQGEEVELLAVPPCCLSPRHTHCVS